MLPVVDYIGRATIRVSSELPIAYAVAGFVTGDPLTLTDDGILDQIMANEEQPSLEQTTMTASTSYDNPPLGTMFVLYLAYNRQLL